MLRLLVEYDGAHFHGWAVQPGQRTVAGALEAALGTFLGHPVRLSVAGRTDAGVHARGQVVSLPVVGAVDTLRLLRAMAALLPEDVAVREADMAPPDFDARLSALWRTYEYRVLVGRPSPLRRGRVYHRREPLDLAELDDCAAATVGQHDFRAFTPTRTDHVFFDRTVTECRWERRGDEVVLTITADAYLRGMVRTLVGSMLEVGRGHRNRSWYRGLLAGAPRSAAGPTMPAHGLTMVGAGYPDDGPVGGASR